MPDPARVPFAGMRWRGFLGVGLLALVGAHPAVAAPDPELGKTAVLSTESGTVLVQERGENGFDRLPRSATVVRLPATVDATRGDVRVRTARGGGRKDNDGIFWKGAFVLSQESSARGVTELRLTNGDAGACVAPPSSLSAASARAFARAAGVKQQLWGNGKGNFKSKGKNGSGSSRGTKWLTQERCDGTRFAVDQGLVETDTQDGNLVFQVAEDQVVQYRCDLNGIQPVSNGFCTSVYSTPSIGLWGGGLLNIGEAGAYDLCLTAPNGEERCTTYELSPPDEDGIRESIVICVADRGPGTYSLRWLIDGVQLGPPLSFFAESTIGQGCTSQP
jgi:hypothetical protein